MKIEVLVKDYLPAFFHSIAISVFNSRQYKTRHSAKYWAMRKYFSDWEYATEEELKKEQSKRLDFFLKNSVDKSAYYKKLCNGSKSPINLNSFPILEKSTLISEFDSLSTINENEGIISFTGGTTGNSTKVIYHPDDMQERFAMLDHFRASYGYKLGLKTAWFSGKELLNQRDIKKGRYHRDDFINRIRFYSTFHINRESAKDYWDNLVKFKPLFLVGFPSSIYEIAKYAHNNGFKLNSVVAIFPTAEKLIEEEVCLIKEVFQCPVVDQYASSEGAPFITECEKGKKHIQLLSGYFEVLDDAGKPANKGEMIVTSFTTQGTPLIRYRIGDGITLSNEKCTCGRHTPIAESIDGRINDYIYSELTGKINLGNISNVTKGVGGIEKIQIIQKVKSEIEVLIVKTFKYTMDDENNLMKAFRARLGAEMSIKIKYVDFIDNEKSGKFRMVKNSLSL